MKKHIRSLLGIEMSIGNIEFKPIILLLGILLFILLAIPLLLVYCFLYVKFTLLDSIKAIREERKRYFKGKFKWF